MIINCIIIDDEPLARKGLKEYIADIDFLALAGAFDSPLKATEMISSGQVQLLFLDIQMPKITGLDFFKSLQNPPPVVFTTAYPQFALDGFEVNALDYLVKPVSFERFLKASLKAREYYEVREKNLTEASSSVEAMQNYVMINTSGKKYITYLTFKALEDYLPADKFLKVHKSYIVALSKVDSIEGNEIRIGQHHIPISRNQKEEVMDKLLKNRFLKR